MESWPTANKHLSPFQPSRYCVQFIHCQQNNLTSDFRSPSSGSLLICMGILFRGMRFEADSLLSPGSLNKVGDEQPSIAFPNFV